jgi:hypothetical protein
MDLGWLAIAKQNNIKIPVNIIYSRQWIDIRSPSSTMRDVAGATVNMMYFVLVAEGKNIFTNGAVHF